MDRELLIEIGVEELPAAWLPNLTRQLAEKLDARLREMRMAPDVPVESYSTPRRLTARVGRIPERQEDLDETITGPAVSAALLPSGEPTPAALGFARKHGIPFEALERHETPKGSYLLARKRQRGKSAVDALPELLGGVLRDLAFPKQMHWDAMLDDGRGELLFGRPIRWLLFLYGGRVVPFAISRMANAAGPLVQEISTGAVTYGHRFLATSGRAGRSIKVRTFDEYRARLLEHFVILDHAERRDRIARELELKARKLSGRVASRDHAALLDEVADLVEYPGVVAGFFDRSFLDLPHEVLTTTLVHHQHFFPVTNDKGELKEAFLAVVNTAPSDERSIARNAERVVTARLRDAKFFWDADRRLRLEDRLDRLDTVIFHKKLGSYRDKAERIEKLAHEITVTYFAEPDQMFNAEKAARLAKADLTSDMVFEFPELQGVMGGIYAREQGEIEEVWKAIYYHYLPVGVEADAAPSRAQLGAAAVSWAALSLADKLDTLVGLLEKDEKVTGSKDPYGLRRAGNGIVRILNDLESLTGLTMRPSLDMLVGAARAIHGFPLLTGEKKNSLYLFLVDRIRHLMQSRGLEYEEIQAMTGHIDVLDRLGVRDILDRAAALAAAIRTPQFAAVAESFKRANNIVDQEWGGVDTTLRWSVGQDLLHEPVELALKQAVALMTASLRNALQQDKIAQALGAIASLQGPLERFFADVRVNVDDEALKDARLALLAEIRDRVIMDFGDISVLAAKRGR